MLVRSAAEVPMYKRTYGNFVKNAYKLNPPAVCTKSSKVTS